MNEQANSILYKIQLYNQISKFERLKAMFITEKYCISNFYSYYIYIFFA